MSIFEVPKASVGIKVMESFVWQLCWHLVHRLGSVMSAPSEAEACSSGVFFECRHNLIQVGTNQMIERLAQYLLAFVAESARHRVVNITTDKASPAGLSLQNSLVVFGSNTAAMCCLVVNGLVHLACSATGAAGGGQFLIRG